MQSWFVSALDRADLLMHGFNLYAVLITDRGRWLLDGLERFLEPPREENAEAEPHYGLNHLNKNNASGAAADNGG
jgi:hypothetical protein